MNSSILEYNRQLETIQRNKRQSQRQANKFVGIAALVIISGIAALYILAAAGIIHLSV